MENKDNETKVPHQQADDKEKTDLPGYPTYPANEDIYNQYQKKMDVNPEDISVMKESDETNTDESWEEKEVEGELLSGDLDVPGSELDDEQEKIGNEDEENNYYSIGSDNHNDLEENQGE